MNKIFANSEEKYLKSVTIYGDSGALYVDEDATTTADPSIVKDLFIKNCLVIYDEDVDRFVYPVAMGLGSNGALTNVDAAYIDEDSSSQTKIFKPIQYAFT